MGDFPRIGIGFELLFQRRRRVVVIVRVVEVQPEEERPPAFFAGVDEIETLRDYLVGAALLRSPRDPLDQTLHRVVERLEATLEAVVGVDVERRDHRPGPEARLRQALGKRRDALFQPPPEIAAQSVPDRIDTGQHGRDGRPRRNRRGIGEADAALRQSIDRRGALRPAPIAAEVVGAQALHGDQEDVPARARAASGGGTGWSAERGRGERRDEQERLERPGGARTECHLSRT